MSEHARVCHEDNVASAAGDAWKAAGGDRRRQRTCPSCLGTSLIRACRVPGVQLQVVTRDGERRSGMIALYSDVCVDCGLTSFYARRAEVAEQLEQLQEGTEAAAPESNPVREEDC